MSAQPYENTADEGSPDFPASLDVLVVYEDAYARARMEGIYGLLMEKFSEEHIIGCRWCWFNELRDPAAAREAALAAKAADLILFSADAASEPSEPVREWIESWIDDKAEQAAALAALLVRNTVDDGRPLATEVYLGEIARRAEMAFLCRVIPVLGGPTNTSLADLEQVPTPVPIHYKGRIETSQPWRCGSRDRFAERLAGNGRAWGHREHWF